MNHEKLEFAAQSFKLGQKPAQTIGAVKKKIKIKFTKWGAQSFPWYPHLKNVRDKPAHKRKSQKNWLLVWFEKARGMHLNSSRARRNTNNVYASAKTFPRQTFACRPSADEGLLRFNEKQEVIEKLYFIETLLRGRVGGTRSGRERITTPRGDVTVGSVDGTPFDGPGNKERERERRLHAKTPTTSGLWKRIWRISSGQVRVSFHLCDPSKA